jgi:ribonuclease PH
MNKNRTRNPNNRSASQLRPHEIKLDIQRNAQGSVLISTGNTRVICAASVEERVPPWLKEKASGWVTAEYGMLPGSGDRRINRKQNSRSTEIQRLIGRSIRAAIDLNKINGYTITLDCDVLDADGGTRTASITGAWVALYIACRKMIDAGKLPSMPITSQIAAVSVGIVNGSPLLDLDYLEDSTADVDMNVIGAENKKLIEVQGTAEKRSFDRKQLDIMLDLAQAGIATLQKAQRESLGL